MGLTTGETETLSAAGASTSGTGATSFASSSLLVSGPVCGVVMGIVVSEGLDPTGSGRLLMTCGSCGSTSSKILAELETKKVVVRIMKNRLMVDFIVLELNMNACAICVAASLIVLEGRFSLLLLKQISSCVYIHENIV